MTTKTITSPPGPTALLDMLGARFHGSVDTDAQLLADNETAWPSDCGAAAAIRRARRHYEAGDLAAAASAVLDAQSCICG